MPPKFQRRPPPPPPEPEPVTESPPVDTNEIVTSTQNGGSE
jgi:hypothetical protein